ncbi:MAG: GNAT family N-acetyltransferase [Gammaproteobacteria bacterium]|nr:GNAT family N-acetyltransferase [Gammaproteobacteria bacterium]
MATTIRDARASERDRRWIEQIYDEYLGDLAAGHTGVFPAAAVTGQGIDELLQGWFRDQRSMPFMILRNEEPAGFALVQRERLPEGRVRVQFRLSEFFVRGPYRRLGVGSSAAQLLFARFAGDWVIAEQAGNLIAIDFWRKVLAEFTGGDFSEQQSYGEVAHRFASGGGARSRPG